MRHTEPYSRTLEWKDLALMHPPTYAHISNIQVVDLSCRKKAEEGAEGLYYVVKDKWQTYTDFVVRSVPMEEGSGWVGGLASAPRDCALQSFNPPTHLPTLTSNENLVKLAAYCDEFLVHGVDVEGMRVGILVRTCFNAPCLSPTHPPAHPPFFLPFPSTHQSPTYLPPFPSKLQEDLVILLGEISPLPVTYAGGARSIEDLERVTELGKGKVREGGGGRWRTREGWLALSFLCHAAQLPSTQLPTYT